MPITYNSPTHFIKNPDDAIEYYQTRHPFKPEDVQDAINDGREKVILAALNMVLDQYDPEPFKEVIKAAQLSPYFGVREQAQKMDSSLLDLSTMLLYSYEGVQLQFQIEDTSDTGATKPLLSDYFQQHAKFDVCKIPATVVNKGDRDNAIKQGEKITVIIPSSQIDVLCKKTRSLVTPPCEIKPNTANDTYFIILPDADEASP